MFHWWSSLSLSLAGLLPAGENLSSPAVVVESGRKVPVCNVHLFLWGLQLTMSGRV